MIRNLTVVSALLLAVARPAVCFAQSPPPTTQHSDRAADAAPAPDETVWTVQAGAILASGNTRSLALSAGSRLSLKRSRNVFAAEVNGNYGRANVRDATTGEYQGWANNAENVGGKARYDRFLTENNALFLSVGALRDRFAGLDVRAQLQVGYLRNFLKTCEDKHRLWGEIGYDLTFDDFDPDPLLDDAGNRLDGDAVIHSVRAFLGYDNHVTESLTFLTGIEALIDVQDADNVRLTSVSELRSKLAGKLQLGVQLSVRFDNVPVEGTENLDTTTTLNLLYSLL